MGKYFYIIILCGIISSCTKTDLLEEKRIRNLVPLEKPEESNQNYFSSINKTTSYYWEYTNHDKGAYYDVLATCLPLIQLRVPNVAVSNANVQLDYDKDGLMDIVVQSTDYDQYWDDTVYVFHNDGGGKFSISKTFVSKIEQGRRAIVNDFDNNGYPDVLIVGTPGERPSVPMNMNDPTRIQKPFLIKFYNNTITGEDLDFGGYYHTTTSGDINGDGYADIIVPNSITSNRPIEVGINNGNGTFRKTYYEYASDITERTWVELFDINGDNKLDFFFAPRGDHKTRVYNSDGTIDLFPDMPDHGITYTFQFNDFNKDGSYDVILNRVKHQNNPYGGYKTQFLTKKNGSYEDVTQTLIDNPSIRLVGDKSNPPLWFDYLDQIDMNKDGYRDLVAGRGSYAWGSPNGGPSSFMVPVWVWDNNNKKYRGTYIEVKK